jgi:phosphomannomutase
MAGLWGSGQHSIVRPGPEGASSILELVNRLASDPPESVNGLTVSGMIDYRVGAETRPTWLGAQDLVQLSFGSRGRALARPSGTEPKLKIYVDLTEAMGEHPMSQQATVSAQAVEVAAELAKVIMG